MNNQTSGSTAIVYLARGADANCENLFVRFRDSLIHSKNNLSYNLYIIFKGFSDYEAMDRAYKIFSTVKFTPILTSDDTFDIGAYSVALRQIKEDFVCFLNTNSEIQANGWIDKLAANLNGGVGMVAATGSFEALVIPGVQFPSFPNIHLRSNAMMMNNEIAHHLFGSIKISNKIDAYLIESGPNSLTQKIFKMGLTAKIVGRNGRGYPPLWWASSGTFRQGSQSNLLVSDNVTRAFEKAPWNDKLVTRLRTWGPIDNRGFSFPSSAAW